MTQKLFQDKSFLLILGSGLVMKVVAVLFAKGYAAIDDHFLVMEVAYNWLYHNVPLDSNSFVYNPFYPSLHIGILWVLRLFSIENPQLQMVFIRLLHALYSILIVIIGARLSLKLAGRKAMLSTTFLLSYFWMFPYLSVRNMVEFVCIPPLMYAFFLGVTVKKDNFLQWIGCGFFFALAFLIRYQTALFPISFAVVLLLQKKWRSLFFFSLSVFICAFLLSSLVDVLAGKYPLQSFIEYALYNLTHSNEYITGQWYKYIVVLGGVFLFPASILVAVLLYQSRKKYVLLLVPVVIFIAFHSFFPNKQERFILPVIPFIIILCCAAYFSNEKHTKGILLWGRKILLGWFLVVNFLLVFFITPHYSKRHLVETMSYFYPRQISSLFIEEGTHKSSHIPLYYAKKNISVVKYKADTADKANALLSDKELPQYVVFFGEKKLQQRITALQDGLNLHLQAEKVIRPAFIERILVYLNPEYNRHQTAHIYKVL